MVLGFLKRMHRQQRRHSAPKKKSATPYVIVIVVIAIAGLFWYLSSTGGTGVDYALYEYTDDAYEPANPVLTIEEYSDFQCPACQAFEPTLKAVRDAYKDEVKVVYKEFPLRTIHEYAQGAAEAAECAREQNRFWAYHDVLFESRKIDKSSLKKHAQGLGLDLEAWEACFDGGAAKPVITTTLLEGQQRGVQGTPTVFVNGEEFPGRSVADFEAALNAAR